MADSVTNQKFRFIITDQQHKAINDVDHNLLVISGPGTGKTAIIAHKVAYLLSLGYKTSDILVTTFTNKATDELKVRVAHYSKAPPHHLQIYTIHSFCYRVLKEFSHYIDYDRDFLLLDDISQKFLMLGRYGDINELASCFPSEELFQKYIFHLLDLFGSFNEHLIERRDIWNYIEKSGTNRLTFNLQPRLLPSLTDGQVYKIFESYRSLMGKNRWLDHSQVLKLAYNLISGEVGIRKVLQGRYKYILVDEFQDTSYIQNEIFKLLVNDGNRICAVGDDDQSIYQFRGASVDNLFNFSNSFSNVETIFIEDNFRSTKSIVNFSNGIIGSSDRRFPKNLISRRDNGSKVMLIDGNTYGDTAKLVCGIIKRLLNEKNISFYSEVVLLFSSVRWDFIGKGYKAVFDKEGIPCIIHRSGNYFDNKEARLVLELLLIFVKGNISYEDLSFILDNLNVSAESYGVIMSNHSYSTFDKFFPKVLEQITDIEDGKKLAMLYKIADKIDTTGVLSILYDIFKLFDLFSKLTNDGNDGSFNQLAYMTSLAQSYEMLGGGSLHSFVKSLTVLREKRTLEEVLTDNDRDGVHISTIHNAKGLEYRVVFLCEFDTDSEWKGNFRIPSELLGYKDSYDSRLRLFYVGITRAKDYLFLAYSKRDKFSNIKPLSSLVKVAMDRGDIQRFNWDDLYLSYYIPKHRGNSFTSISLSYSAIRSYLSCPLRYCFEYVYGFKVPSNDKALFGNIIHKVLERVHRSYMLGQGVSEDVILDIFIKQLGFYGLGGRSGFMDIGKAMLLGYIKNYSNKFSMIDGVEKDFEVFFGDNRLVGAIDLIFKADDGMVDIVDFKTSKVDSYAHDQLLTYAFAYNMEHNGRDNNLVSSIMVYDLAENKAIEYPVCINSLDRVKMDISSIFDRVMARDFSPKPGDSCSYCYFSNCCSYSCCNRQ